jgi:hypothetical protein
MTEVPPVGELLAGAPAFPGGSHYADGFAAPLKVVNGTGTPVNPGAIT